MSKSEHALTYLSFERTIVHFGSPPGTQYTKPDTSAQIAVIAEAMGVEKEEPDAE